MHAVLVQNIDNVYEGRLLRKVALRAVEWGKGCWIGSIAKCVDKYPVSPLPS